MGRNNEILLFCESESCVDSLKVSPRSHVSAQIELVTCCSAGMFTRFTRNTLFM